MSGPEFRERLKLTMDNDLFFEAIGNMPFIQHGVSVQVTAEVISSVTVTGSLTSAFEADIIYCKGRL